MRIFVSMMLGAALAQAQVQAQDERIERGPVPDWATPSELMPVPADASGLIFVRRQDALIHLDAEGQAQYLGYRIRILHPNALQMGNIQTAWNPASGAPVVHFIKVHRDGETIDVLEKSSFEILRREDQLEAAMLDGILTAVLRVPDLRVGDELEVGLTTRHADPTLGKNDSGLLFLGPSPAPGRYRLGLSWDKGLKPNIRMTPDMAPVARPRADGVDFSFDNPAMLTPPKDAPGRYQWQRIVEFTDFADWATISRHFAPLFAKAARIDDGSALDREAARIAAAHAEPLDRARAALGLVQRDVRYIYVGLGNGNLTPATAEETWQRRYGDCKGKTALLLALLARLGIEAEAVLANNSGGDDGLDERLPNPGMFDHVLVRARIDGTTYWLDGTLPPVAGPGTTPVIAYRWVLPLTERGSALKNIEWRMASRPNEITLYEIDARAGFDKPAKVTNKMIVRGLPGLVQQVQLSGLTPDQLRDGMRQQLIGATWETVDDVTWRYDQKAEASILTVTGTWTVDWDDDGDGDKSYALPGGGFSPPERRARAADQDQDLPYYSAPEFDCQVTTLRLPATTNAANWSFKSGYDTRIFGKNYYRAFDLRDGAIRMVRGLRVEQPEIDAASARRDNGRIAGFDNSMAWVSYKPEVAKPHDPASRVVPATYDIDWTADKVPCLSPAAISRAEAR
ncbi:Transglutaminase-like protein [uncultured Sphingopyxis sp.]|uniref:Transglutaminase-like protein n=1 Tax=uncultured Sphingopyxis sp. TaxID=310581 RepID=A0A1Y5Q1J2_9SPHN|nr:Transglutaminase-like protein [uncultured Sphingopyxis sp.]